MIAENMVVFLELNLTDSSRGLELDPSNHFLQEGINKVLHSAPIYSYALQCSAVISSVVMGRSAASLTYAACFIYFATQKYVRKQGLRNEGKGALSRSLEFAGSLRL